MIHSVIFQYINKMIRYKVILDQHGSFTFPPPVYSTKESSYPHQLLHLHEVDFHTFHLVGTKGLIKIEYD